MPRSELLLIVGLVVMAAFIVAPSASHRRAAPTLTAWPQPDLSRFELTGLPAENRNLP